jgi:hypothetical protein
VIIESHRNLGNKWTAISRLLNGRPANAIKNHWNSTLKRQVQFGSEIGSGSPRPGKRQRATVGHQSRKKRRLDVSSYESGKPIFHFIIIRATLKHYQIQFREYSLVKIAVIKLYKIESF